MRNLFKALFGRGGRAPSNRIALDSIPPKNIHTPPDDVAKILKTGNAALEAQNNAAAIEAYEKLVSLQPANSLFHINLGFALMQVGNHSDAIASLEKAVSLDNKSVDGFYLLGKANFETGDADAAEKYWDSLCALSMGVEHVYCDFCRLLFNKGDIERAKKLMSIAIESFPHNADFHFYMANLHAECAEYADATKAYEKSINLNPNSPHALSSYGSVLRQIGKLDLSLEVIRQALELAPDAPEIFSNHLMGIQYSSKLSRHEKFTAHQQYSNTFETPLMVDWGRYTNRISQFKKLKIGYVSGDFRNHSLIFFIEPIIKNHNRTQFEVFCYYSHPVHDLYSERIKNLADKWIPCSHLTDEALATRIRSDGIDVLIDLSGHTGHNRLLVFARKPAPIQMTWLGYQATTGLRAIDFRITEESLDPIGTSEMFHAEKLLRLPSSGTFSPSPDSPPVNPLPCLSEAPFTFGCLNNPTKITDSAIQVWSSILKINLSARLLLGNSTPDWIEKVLNQFQLNGIDQARIIFSPKVSLKEYLELHHQIDLALDTFPYNGGTTTFHSLFMGVPIVALHGDSAISKVGASIMCGLGLENYCANDAEEYVERAVYFSKHPEELSKVRSTLRVKMTDVTNVLSKEVTLSLERSLETCWADFCNTQDAAMSPLSKDGQDYQLSSQ